jgi:hypothetical protein
MAISNRFCAAQLTDPTRTRTMRPYLLQWHVYNPLATRVRSAMPTSTGHPDRQSEHFFNPQIAQQRDQLETLVTELTARLAELGYPNATPRQVITEVSYHHRRLRTSYHEVSDIELLCWSLASGYILTSLGQIAFFGLSHKDEQGRSLFAKPKLGSDRIEMIGGWKTIEYDLLPAADLSALIKSITSF